MYWKIEAEGDTVYIEAPTVQGAKDRLTAVMGSIPDSLLKVTKIKKLPEGEELL